MLIGVIQQSQFPESGTTHMVGRGLAPAARLQTLQCCFSCNQLQNSKTQKAQLRKIAAGAPKGISSGLKPRPTFNAESDILVS